VFLRLITAILFLASTSLPASGADLPDRARQIMAAAAVTYSTSFQWHCSRTTWTKAVDNPLIMGGLWAAYGFAPAYSVMRKDGVLEVRDPTGLAGTISTFRGRSGERIYVCDGRLDHWAVPFFNEGEAVFVLSAEAVRDSTHGKVEVYVWAASGIGNAVLELGEVILRKHIDNRVTLNLQDARKIVETIESSPATSAAMLRGPLAERFETVFAP